MSDEQTYLWKLTMPGDGEPLILDPGTWLTENFTAQEYVAQIGEALIQIGTNFLLSVVNNEIHQVPNNDKDLTDLDDMLGDVSFE